MEEVKIKEKIQLNESQSIILQGLINWSHNKDKSNLFATLKGSAGTGKTTITNEFIKNCVFKYGIVVSAPTHKAKKVIESATNLKSFTIQKLLGLRPNTDLDNFDINFPQFDSQAESEIQHFRLLIIDEASMLNKDLFELICEEAKRYNVKVLFIGDELQLPPVNEMASKAITDISNIFELTVIVRQKDTNPLADLLIALRHDIINNNNTFERLIEIKPENINDNNEGYITLNSNEFMGKIADEFRSNEYTLDKDYCKYTAWTNGSIQGANKMIRTLLTNEIIENESLILGDVLMSYKTISDTYIGNIIINSEEYVVNEINKQINKDGLNGWIVKLKCLSTNELTIPLFIINSNNYNKFLELHNELLADAIKYKGKAWKEYYEFKNYNLLLEDLKDSKGKLIVKKDLDYGYGITIHKTQGSTYENIFVNLKNIKLNTNIIERKKLIYVALSRARKRVYLYNK